MNKIILFGDGILAGPQGFGEVLLDFLFLHHPRAPVSSSIYGDKDTDYARVLRECPLHIIGKTPQLVVLALGKADIHSSKPVPAILEEIRHIISMVETKTKARLYIANVCSPLFAGEDAWGKAEQLNRGLAEVAISRGGFIDLHGCAETFLDEHRQGPGEKHSLHSQDHALTSLGRLVLADFAYRAIHWPLEPDGLKEADAG